MCHDDRSGEEGLALITSLLAILILMGLSVLFVAAATNLTKQSRISTTYERAIHLSEAAIDDVIARVSTEDPESGPFHVTDRDADGNPVVYPDPPPADQSAEEAWAIGVANAAPDSEVIQLDEGEAVGIRPQNSSGTGLPLDVIYGVSYVPRRGPDAVETRVIKVAFQRKLLNPRFAFQTGPGCGQTPPPGGLALQGSGRILDGDPSVYPPADVHSNGSITVTGSNFVVEGTITAGPGQTVGAGVKQPNGTAAPTAGNQPCQEIPDITPRGMYLRTLDETFYVGRPPGDQWRWDLCYSATGTPFARRPSPTGVPCSNTTDQIDLSSVGQFQGWTFDFAKKVWRANAVQGGIYYIYGASANINGSNGATTQRVTVFLESLGTDTSGSGTSCTGQSNTGNLCLSGNPKLSPAFKDTQFVVSRDIEFGGTPGSEFEGFVTAGEQIGATGNAAIKGAVIAQDREDTPGSVLHQNIVSGSMVLTFNEDLNPPIDSVVQVVGWNEIK